MAIHAIQNIFNGGVISETMSARMDIARYQQGAQIMQNCLPMPQGGATRRPGTKYLGLAKDQDINNFVKLQAFVFSASQSLVLEFGHLYMRVWNNDGTLINFTLTTPYKGDEVTELSIAQSADVVFVAHKNHAPRQIIRLANNNWRIETLTFLPQINTPTISTITQQGTEPDPETAGDKITNEYVVTALTEDFYESNASIAVEAETYPLTQSYYNRISYSAISNAVEYRIYKKRGGAYGFIGRSDKTFFDDKNIEPDTADTPVEYKNPFASTGNFPSLVFLHQQRLGYASSVNNPLTVWLSRSSNLYSFASSSPPKADDSIEATLASTQANAITDITTDRDTVLVFTEGSEWIFAPTSGTALSPTNVSFQLQTSHGSEPYAKVLKTSDSALFVQRGSNVIRDIAYTYDYDKYQTSDLSILSRDLLKKILVFSWCYQQEPYGIIWISNTEGKLIALTYLKEHDIIGWHTHETDGFIEYITSVPSSSDDKLFMSVIREKGDGTKIRTIELLDDYFDSQKLEEAYFVDSGRSYNFSTKTNTITNLDHLEGRSVSIFCDGYTHNPCTVINGSITLERPVSYAHVGLPYNSVLQPTTPEITAPDGTTFFRIRKIVDISFRLYNSMNFEVMLEGLNTSAFAHKISTINGVRMLQTTPTFVHKADITIEMAGGFDVPVAPTFQVNTPTPLTILASTSSLDIASNVGTQKI